MSPKKVIVLGIDGLEPNIINHLFKKNKLPHLKKLPFYSKLKTTIPPQSPTAWASFITGLSPQKHQLTDFVKRKPENYQLYLAHSPKTKKTAFLGQPFWQTSPKLYSQILFLPDTYPALPQPGKVITGMGTPDLLGTEGSFTLFTTQKLRKKLKRGQVILVPKNKKIQTKIPGPKYKAFKKTKTSEINLRLQLEKNQIKIKLPEEKEIKLQPKKFSPWLRFKFKLSWPQSVHGLAQFYLVSLSPLKLYLGPLHPDPQKPHLPICFPKNYSQQLVKKYGTFATLGLPHDTWAFDQNLFSQKAFLKQADQYLKERKRIILGELENFNQGLFVAYLGTTDTIQHMFWGKSQIINHYYQEMDDFIGQVQKQIKNKTPLFILSDHGFGAFHTEVHLNAWLKEKGYLKLKKEKKPQEFLKNINWNQTQAYALGFNSLYLNLKGREGKGIVSSKNKTKLLKKIKQELKKLKDPKTKKPIIKNIYPRFEPDLIIGYYRGYRASWETAVGTTPNKVFLPRKGKWQGDHLFDVTEVPGVILANQKLKEKNLSLEKIMPLALKSLGIKFP